MHALLLALVLQLTAVETVTSAADHYDKYASIAFDREATMWIAYSSMHGDETSIDVNFGGGDVDLYNTLGIHNVILSFTMRDINVPAGEASYYVPVTQADGGQAWSAPVWVTK